MNVHSLTPIPKGEAQSLQAGANGNIDDKTLGPLVKRDLGSGWQLSRETNSDFETI